MSSEREGLAREAYLAACGVGVVGFEVGIGVIAARREEVLALSDGGL